jgi:tetratricopeptide (TPR) repeat protein
MHDQPSGLGSRPAASVDTYLGTPGTSRQPPIIAAMPGLRHLFILPTAALIALGGCAPSAGDATGHRDEPSGWVGPFAGGTANHNANGLAESRQLDSIQHAMDEGLYESARKQLNALIQDGCQHPTVFYLEAKLLYQQGNFEGALPWCDRAIAASPYWVDPRVVLAQSYIRLKRLAGAENVYGDLDRLAPRLAWGPYGIGVVALMRGDQARATILLDEALHRDPQHAPSLRVRAELAQGKDPLLEENLLGRLIALEPDSAWAYARFGELALAENKLDDAHRAFLRSYELEPDVTTARRLAELAQRRDDPTEAKHWQERAGTKVAPPPVPANP